MGEGEGNRMSRDEAHRFLVRQRWEELLTLVKDLFKTGVGERGDFELTQSLCNNKFVNCLYQSSASSRKKVKTGPLLEFPQGLGFTVALYSRL